jgi:hypothetical protein
VSILASRDRLSLRALAHAKVPFPAPRRSLTSNTLMNRAFFIAGAAFSRSGPTLGHGRVTPARLVARPAPQARRRTLDEKVLSPTSQGGSLNLPDPHLNQYVDLGLSGSVKSNAIVAQHDPASETN